MRDNDNNKRRGKGGRGRLTNRQKNFYNKLVERGEIAIPPPDQNQINEEARERRLANWDDEQGGYIASYRRYGLGQTEPLGADDIIGNEDEWNQRRNFRALSEARSRFVTRAWHRASSPQGPHWRTSSERIDRERHGAPLVGDDIIGNEEEWRAARNRRAVDAARGRLSDHQERLSQLKRGPHWRQATEDLHRSAFDNPPLSSDELIGEQKSRPRRPQDPNYRPVAHPFDAPDAQFASFANLIKTNDPKNTARAVRDANGWQVMRVTRDVRGREEHFDFRRDPTTGQMFVNNANKAHGGFAILPQTDWEGNVTSATDILKRILDPSENPSPTKALQRANYTTDEPGSLYFNYHELSGGIMAQITRSIAIPNRAAGGGPRYIQDIQDLLGKFPGFVNRGAGGTITRYTDERDEAGNVSSPGYVSALWIEGTTDKDKRNRAQDVIQTPQRYSVPGVPVQEEELPLVSQDWTGPKHGTRTSFAFGRYWMNIPEGMAYGNESLGWLGRKARVRVSDDLKKQFSENTVYSIDGTEIGEIGEGYRAGGRLSRLPEEFGVDTGNYNLAVFNRYVTDEEGNEYADIDLLRRADEGSGKEFGKFLYAPGGDNAAYGGVDVAGRLPSAGHWKSIALKAWASQRREDLLSQLQDKVGYDPDYETASTRKIFADLFYANARGMGYDEEQTRGFLDSDNRINRAGLDVAKQMALDWAETRWGVETIRQPLSPFNVELMRDKSFEFGGKSYNVLDNLEEISLGEGRGSYFLADITSPVWRAEAITNIRPEYANRTATFGPEELSNMAIFSQEAYIDLLQRDAMGEFENRAREMVNAIYSNVDPQMAEQMGLLVGNDGNFDDRFVVSANDLNINSIYDDILSASPDDKSVGRHQRQLLQTIGNLTDNRALRIGNVTFAGGSTLASYLTVDQTGEAISDHPTDVIAALRANDDLIAAQEAGDRPLRIEELTRIRDERVFKALTSGVELANLPSIVKNATGITLPVLGGPAVGIEGLAYDEAVATHEQFQSLISHFDKEQQAEMIARFEAGEAVMPSTMYPHSNLSDAFENLRLISLDTLRQRKGFENTVLPQRTLGVSPQRIAGWAKDMDADYIRAFLSLRDLPVRDLSEMQRKAELNRAFELEKQREYAEETPEQFQAKLDKSTATAESMVADAHKTLELQKKESGPSYNWSVEEMTPFTALMGIKAGLGGDTSQAKVLESMSRIGQIAYQHALEVEELTDPALRELREARSMLSYDSAKNPLKQQAYLATPNDESSFAKAIERGVSTEGFAGYMARRLAGIGAIEAGYGDEQGLSRDVARSLIAREDAGDEDKVEKLREFLVDYTDQIREKSTVNGEIDPERAKAIDFDTLEFDTERFTQLTGHANLTQFFAAGGLAIGEDGTVDQAQLRRASPLAAIYAGYTGLRAANKNPGKYSLDKDTGAMPGSMQGFARWMNQIKGLANAWEFASGKKRPASGLAALIQSIESSMEVGAVHPHMAYSSQRLASGVVPPESFLRFAPESSQLTEVRAGDRTFVQARTDMGLVNLNPNLPVSPVEGDRRLSNMISASIWDKGKTLEESNWLRAVEMFVPKDDRQEVLDQLLERGLINKYNAEATFTGNDATRRGNEMHDEYGELVFGAMGSTLARATEAGLVERDVENVGRYSYGRSDFILPTGEVSTSADGGEIFSAAVFDLKTVDQDDERFVKTVERWDFKNRYGSQLGIYNEALAGSTIGDAETGMYAISGNRAGVIAMPQGADTGERAQFAYDTMRARLQRSDAPEGWKPEEWEGYRHEALGFMEQVSGAVGAPVPVASYGGAELSQHLDERMGALDIFQVFGAFHDRAATRGMGATGTSASDYISYIEGVMGQKPTAAPGVPVPHGSALSMARATTAPAPMPRPHPPAPAEPARRPPIRSARPLRQPARGNISSPAGGAPPPPIDPPTTTAAMAEPPEDDNSIINRKGKRSKISSPYNVEGDFSDVEKRAIDVASTYFGRSTTSVHRSDASEIHVSNDGFSIHLAAMSNTETANVNKAFVDNIRRRIATEVFGDETAEVTDQMFSNFTTFHEYGHSVSAAGKTPEQLRQMVEEWRTERAAFDSETYADEAAYAEAYAKLPPEQEANDEAIKLMRSLHEQGFDLETLQKRATQRPTPRQPARAPDHRTDPLRWRGRPAREAPTPAPVAGGAGGGDDGGRRPPTTGTVGDSPDDDGEEPKPIPRPTRTSPATSPDAITGGSRNIYQMNAPSLSYASVTSALGSVDRLEADRERFLSMLDAVNPVGEGPRKPLTYDDYQFMKGYYKDLGNLADVRSKAQSRARINRGEFQSNADKVWNRTLAAGDGALEGLVNNLTGLLTDDNVIRMGQVESVGKNLRKPSSRGGGAIPTFSPRDEAALLSSLEHFDKLGDSLSKTAEEAQKLTSVTKDQQEAYKDTIKSWDNLAKAVEKFDKIAVKRELTSKEQAERFAAASTMAATRDDVTKLAEVMEKIRTNELPVLDRNEVLRMGGQRGDHLRNVAEAAGVLDSGIWGEGGNAISRNLNIATHRFSGALQRGAERMLHGEGIFHARLAWGMLGQPVVNAMDNYRAQATAIGLGEVQSGIMSVGDLMNSEYGERLRVSSRRAYADYEFGRQADMAYGDIYNGMRGQGVMGAGAAIFGPAAAIGVGATSLTGNPALGGVLGLFTAATGLGSYMGNAADNWRAIAAYRQSRNPLQHFEGWAGDFASDFVARFDGFATNTGSYNLDPRDVNAEDMERLVQHYRQGLATSDMDTDYFLQRAQAMGYSRSDAMSWVSADVLDWASREGIDPQQAAAYRNYLGLIDPDSGPTDQRMTTLQRMQQMGLDDPQAFLSMIAQSQGSSPDDLQAQSFWLDYMTGVTSTQLYDTNAPDNLTAQLDVATERNRDVNLMRRLSEREQRDFYHGVDAPALGWTTQWTDPERRMLEDQADIMLSDLAVASPDYFAIAGQFFESDLNNLLSQNELKRHQKYQQDIQRSVPLFDQGVLYGTNPQDAGSIMSGLVGLRFDPSISNQQREQAWAFAQGDRFVMSQQWQTLGRGNLMYQSVDTETGMSPYFEGVSTEGARNEYDFLTEMDVNRATGEDMNLFRLSREDAAGGERTWQKRLRETQYGIEDFQFQQQTEQRLFDRLMTTGGTSGLTSDGFAVSSGQGIGSLAKLFEQYGLSFNPGNGMSIWQLEDAGRRLQRTQQDFSNRQAGQSLATQWSQFQTQGQQWRESYALNQQQFQMNTGYQRQQMQMGREMQVKQQGWQREDLSFSRAMSEINFGWAMEDYDRNIRYARGREKRNLMREQERSVIRHSMQMSQQDRQEGRLNETQAYQDQEFELKKQHFEESIRLQEQEMEMSRRHWEENRTFQEKFLELQTEAHEKNLEWLSEERALEDQRVLMNRQGYELQLAMAEELMTRQREAQLVSRDFSDALQHSSNTLGMQNGQLDVWTKKLKAASDAMGSFKMPSFNSGGGGSAGASGSIGAPIVVPVYGGVIGGILQSKKDGGYVVPLDDMPAFNDGGFTGYGHPDAIAGVVHGREYVVPENGSLVIRNDNTESLMRTMVNLMQTQNDLLRQLANKGLNQTNATIYTNNTSPQESLSLLDLAFGGA